MIVNIAYWVLLSFMFIQHEAQLKIIPTDDRDVFKVIYKADFDWDVELQLTDEKGRKKLSKKVEKTDGFLLPINIAGEPSGKFTIIISTPAYDISESFDYLNGEDWTKQVVVVDYNPDRQSVTISSKEILQEELFVSINNDYDETLVEDKIGISESTLYRVYNLAGAPGREVSVRVYTNNYHVVDESFDF